MNELTTMLAEVLRHVSDEARHPDYDWPIWLSKEVDEALRLYKQAKAQPVQDLPPLPEPHARVDGKLGTYCSFESTEARRGDAVYTADQMRDYARAALAATPAPAHLPDATPYLPSAPCGTSTDWSLDERAAIIAGMTFYAARCAEAWGVKLAGQGKEASNG